jgi:hypothetical protein
MAEQMYWANKPENDIAELILNKVKDYRETIRNNGMIALWQDVYKEYYDGINTKGEITQTGAAGNRFRININHFRSIIDNIVSLTTSNRPAFKPKAINTDYDSEAQTILADGLLEYYFRQCQVELYTKRGVKLASIFSESATHVYWDKDIGREVSVDEKTQQIGREGDLRFEVLPAWDIARDTNVQDADNMHWIIVCTRVNRWDLAAKYPDKKDEILKAPNFDFDTAYNAKLGIFQPKTSDDIIELYHFYHKESSVVVGGRQVKCLANNVVIEDSELEFGVIPVARISYSELEGSPFSSTIAFDMSPIQKANRMVHSTIVTNQTTFGVQNIAVQEGTDVDVNFEGDLQIVTYPQGANAPAPMAMCATPAEVFNYAGISEGQMEKVSGMNAMARGQAAPGQSGSAMAFQQSLAVLATSSLQQSYALYLEFLGTLIIKILQKKASTKRVAHITGKYNKQYIKSFDKTDLSNITNVIVDITNPTTRLASYREEQAKTLITAGLIKTPEEYFMVLETGTVKQMYQAEVRDIMLINNENEALAEGVDVAVIDTDNHALHVPEHNAELYSLDVRNNPEKVKNILNHIYKHIKAASMMPPELAIFLGRQPFQNPSMMPPQPPMNQPGQVPSEAVTPNGANGPNLPQMPVGPGGKRVPAPAQTPARS